jgi:outer membrane protein assembly factor BamE
MMRYSTILLALLCVACGNYSANVPTIKPYKMDIQQGNVVTPKMMMQLRPGMTKSQVRFIMGTPLLVDSFHSDRWDYFYQMRKDGKIIEQRRIILDFEGDNLAHVRGDVIPAGGDSAVADDKSKSQQPKSVVKPAVKEKGMLDKLKFWGDDEEPKKDGTKPAEPAKLEVKPELKTETEPKPTPVVTEPAKPVVKEESAKPAAQEEKKGWLDKLKFWGDDEKAAPAAKTVEPVKTAPVKAAEPVKTETPAAEPVKPAPAKVESKASTSAAEPASAPRRPSLPEVAPKAPPKPAADLPSEDSPDFFEKMLEKIGF